MNEALKTFVETQLDELGLNPFEAARAAGLERSYLNDILIGKKNSIRDDKKEQVAKALNVSLETIYRVTSEGQSNRGAVSAGAQDSGAASDTSSTGTRRTQERDETRLGRFGEYVAEGILRADLRPTTERAVRQLVLDLLASFEAREASLDLEEATLLRLRDQSEGDT